MIKELLTYSVVAVSLLFLGSCSENSSPTNSNVMKDNSLSISLALPDCDSLSKGVVIISKSGFDTITKVLSIEKDRVYGTVENIPSGQNLHIVINIYGRDMNVVYSGDAYADVFANKVTDVTINLKTVKGTVKVTGVFNNDTTTYNISGNWSISQTNNNLGTIGLTQVGTSITGYSNWSHHSNGPITGNITGDIVNFRITYPEGVIGYYTAKISDNGNMLTGSTTSSSGDSANWNATKLSSIKINVSGSWSISQSNSNSGNLTFSQEVTVIAGYSNWSTHSNGPITGTVNGDSISFKITYPEGTIGYYSGKIQSTGNYMNGITTSSRGDTATWESKKVAILTQQ